MTDAEKQELVETLRAMDAQQQETDEFGAREIAWYYYRPSIEQILGLAPGTLDRDGAP